MNWFFNMVFLGTACSAVLVENVIFSESSSSFPKLEAIESVFKRSFENASYTESLDGERTRSGTDKHADMPQDVLSYRQHGYHPANAGTWKLQCVWKAMRIVASHLPQIVSSNNDLRTMTEIRNLCESHASEYCGVEYDELHCDPNQVYRSIDGTCNNLNYTRWGSVLQPFERFLPADYGEDCTAPWVSIGGSNGCFLFIQDRMNWNKARSYCQRNAGDLIILDSESKRRDMMNYMERQGLRNGRSRHLGANDRSGSWRWLNGNSVTNGWRQYNDDEPDDDEGDDTCMYLYTDPYPSGRYDLLSDYKCTTERYFICETKATTTGTFSGPFDNIWNDDQCRFIKGFGGGGGFSLSGCKSACLRYSNSNCTAISFNEEITRCQLHACPLSVPAPKLNSGYHGYSLNSGCTAPWVSIGGSNGCFLFIQDRMNWNNARSYCQRNAGDLIILDTESKRRDMMNYMERQGLRNGRSRHLGANDRSGSWRWLNGNSVTNGWRQYNDDEPDDDEGDDTCMYLYTDPYPSGRYDLLSDYKCTTERYFICEQKATTTGASSLRRSKKDEELPNPRKISHALSNSEPRGQPKVSLMLMQWGQFLDHDITLTPEREVEKEVDGSKAIMCCNEGMFKNSESLWEDCVPIDVTEDDYYQMDGPDGRQCLRFIRSMPASRGCAFTPMEQMNRITSFVDGSMIYGSDADVADSLRTKSRGFLNTTMHSNDQPLPPRGNQNGYPAQKCPQAESMDRCFLAGDVRVDEIPSLTAMHTTFIRLHNIIAKDLAKLNPQWTHDDEKLFQETRRIVIALIQQTTYRDWLPHVVGPTLMEEYHLDTGSQGYRDTYNANVNPTIRNVFATAAFRFGHSLIAEIIKAAIPANDLPVPGHFFNISVIESDDTSPSSLLKGLTRCPAQPIDPVVEPAFTNSLFADKPEADGIFFGLDLVSINIQRGRDHGIPSYREWRTFCGLEDLTTFEELKKVMPEDLVKIFTQTYKDIDDIDLFPAGLAENFIGDGILGPTFSCIITRQFANTKHGDRFWYEREDQPKPFTPEQLNSIRSLGLASILCKVSEHTTFDFQPDPFLVADPYGNKVMSCSSYNFIDLWAWKEY